MSGLVNQAGTSSAGAVTWLFVPGDRPERFDKAVTSGADAVILDLEDAVAEDGKEQARESIGSWLSQGRAWVRLNASGTAWYAGDVESLRRAPGLLGVVLPKAEDPALLRQLRNRLGRSVGVVALVESALGVHRAVDIASCRAVDRLAFGSIDYSGDIGADGSWDALLLARSTLVLASRLAGKEGPIDGVTTALKDPGQLAADVAAARALGFTAKLCIHPAQLGPVADGFAPSPADVDWAERILAAIDGAATSGGAGRGAVAVDGAMIDRPVVTRARRILDARRS